MRYRPTDYAKFLISLEDGPSDNKDILKKLALFLQKTGDIKDWRKILESYEFLHSKKIYGKTATVKYAGAIDKNKIKEELKNFEVDFVEDKNLLGGITIKIGDEKIDNSLRNRLEEIKKVLIK
jgi:F0F1-type ATP synthase delta subunit